MSGSYISQFVLKHNIGWLLNDINDLEILLNKLNKKRYLIDQKILNIKKIKPLNSWNSRTLKVKNSLLNDSY